MITHLQYVDDTIFFYPPNMNYLMNIKKTLICFHLATGLQVNFHKTYLIGVNIYKSWLQEVVDVQMDKFPSLISVSPWVGTTLA